MARLAIDLCVVLVERLSGHRVIERSGRPVGMTGLAGPFAFLERNLLMANAATDRRVMSRERPPCSGMVERGYFRRVLRSVTVTAFLRTLHVMARGAGVVMILQGLGKIRLGFSFFVAPGATVLAMAFGATETEAVNMFLVAEENDSSWNIFILGIVAPLLWLRNGRVHTTHDVILRRYGDHA